MYHKLENMPKILISVFLIAFFSGISSFAQESERYLEVRGTSELEMPVPVKCHCKSVMKEPTRYKASRPAADGSFSFKLEINKQYTIEVVKRRTGRQKDQF